MLFIAAAVPETLGAAKLEPNSISPFPLSTYPRTLKDQYLELPAGDNGIKLLKFKLFEKSLGISPTTLSHPFSSEGSSLGKFPFFPGMTELWTFPPDQTKSAPLFTPSFSAS